MSAEMGRLEQLGYQPGSTGEIILSGPAATLLAAWSSYLTRLLRPYCGGIMRAPLFLDCGTLDAAGYLQHFPQQVFYANNSLSPEPDGRCLTPAACFHVYPTLAGRALDREMHAVLVEGHCARHEGGVWQFPFRASAFHMLELVIVGAADTVRELRDEVQQVTGSALGGLGQHGEWVPATDAFFLGNDEGARIIQKLKGLKQEFTVESCGAQVALASINNHEDYFGGRFDIRVAGERAHSCCLAFGLERLTAHSLLQWGGEPAAWPEELWP